MPLTRVLFLCIGNSCRSQMAEGFARAYGSDVIDPISAGLSPATFVADLTKETMLEKNIDMSNAFPKLMVPDLVTGCDLVINISGKKIPGKFAVPVEEWKVRDPIGEKPEVFRDVANEIEHLVMRLILRLRVAATAASGVSTGKPGFDRVRKGPRQ